jgi:hypothetical protein
VSAWLSTAEKTPQSAGGSITISGFLPGVPGLQSLKRANTGKALIEGNLWL